MYERCARCNYLYVWCKSVCNIISLIENFAKLLSWQFYNFQVKFISSAGVTVASVYKHSTSLQTYCTHTLWMWIFQDICVQVYLYIYIYRNVSQNDTILFWARFQIMTQKFCSEYFMLMTLLRHSVVGYLCLFVWAYAFAWLDIVYVYACVGICRSIHLRLEHTHKTKQKKKIKINNTTSG